MKIRWEILTILTLIVFTSATLNPSKNKKGKSKATPEAKVNSGAVDKNVFDRNLVEIEPQSTSIISEANTYYRETGLKNFNGTVLGYVTPVKSTRHNFFSKSINK